MFLIDLEFRALRPIFSLPEWHGARWSAWLRNACRLAGFGLEEVATAIFPFRHGAGPIRMGTPLSLRLLIQDSGLFLLPALLSALRRAEDRGQFSALSLGLISANDAVGDEAIWRNGAITGVAPRAFSGALLKPEAEVLAALEEWTIQLTAPMRLPLPKGRHPRGEDVDRYSGPDELATPGGLANLLARVRLVDAGPVGAPQAELMAFQLQWEDMRYNERRQMVLGGVTGWMKWRGSLNLAQASRLALGQYLGAGKNGRFGLGFWSVPELAQCRAARL